MLDFIQNPVDRRGRKVLLRQRASSLRQGLSSLYFPTAAASLPREQAASLQLPSRSICVRPWPVERRQTCVRLWSPSRSYGSQFRVPLCRDYQRHRPPGATDCWLIACITSASWAAISGCLVGAGANGGICTVAPTRQALGRPKSYQPAVVRGAAGACRGTCKEGCACETINFLSFL